MDYVSMVENEVFFLEQAQRQEAMKRYIKECQILATGKNIPYKLNALNEDLKESMTGLWQKIKTIFTRIWLKFLENLDKFVKSDADYLKSYQNIILNKKAPDVNWKMPDYKQVRDRCFAGIPDFNQYVDETFVDTMAKNAQEATGNDANIDEKKANWQYEIHKRFCAVDNITKTLQKDDDFNTVVKEYFSGGEDQEFAASELNMTDLYNTCFSSETIINELKKTQVKYNKWIEDVERKYNATYKQFYDMVQKSKAQQNTKDSADQAKAQAQKDGNTDEANAQDVKSREAQGKIDEINNAREEARKELKDQEEKAKKAAAEAKQPQTSQNSSMNLYSSVYNRVFSEAEVSSSSSASTGNSSKTYVAPASATGTSGKGVSTGAGNTAAKNAAEANRKQQEKNAAVATAGAATKAADAGESSTLDEKDLQIFATNVTTYSTICTETITTIFGAKCNGITKMRNDYMQIIRYHVKYWLGKPNDSDDNVTTQTATPNPDIKQAVTSNTPGV